ncbi:hypothetical protein FFLO_03024 [Filobasidium floriforme]|uniref:Ras-domain-containing protein n=1 Tax=Filobasidium floriforme TaxID=5210 RepID=A0A8K0NR73_9TREE|nr:ras family-domain-containing protein [Filobasidium floriforme]KAG7553517.1 hypothetical protein FFLO_03024 [Filobasidium floriforme]KAH8081510.1 ras family-domain-containing protein [Filobasidium floriforme]
MLLIATTTEPWHAISRYSGDAKAAIPSFNLRSLSPEFNQYTEVLPIRYKRTASSLQELPIKSPSTRTVAMSASTDKPYPSNLKLLLIGNSSVGKSSLLLRFTDDDFLSDEETTATIGVDFKVKQLEVEGRKFKLSIWDTAGQERFRTLTSSYYRGAQGVILVYDVSSRTSFQALDSWFRELSTYTSPEVIKMIVGNKLDVGDAPPPSGGKGAREVSTEEGERYANAKGCLFLETSAKTNTGVMEAFSDLVIRITETPSLWSNDPTLRTQPRRGNVQLEEDDAPPGWTCAC